MSAMQTHSYDVIVIGAGHNGLVAAATLTKAGKRVLLLERSQQMGGAMNTSEISPDYRISTAAHMIEALPPRLERRLRLKKYGLRYDRHPVMTIALDRDGKHLHLPYGTKPVEGLSAADSEAYARFSRQREGLARLLTHAMAQRADDTLGHALQRLLWRAAFMRQVSLAELTQYAPARIGDILDREFESPLLKGALALDALMGQSEGPYEPGTALQMLHRTSQRQRGARQRVPLGGLGALAEALCGAILACGGEIRPGVEVSKIIVHGGHAAGVETASGEKITAAQVLSCIDARTTMLALVGAAHVDTGLAKSYRQTTHRGATAKINLALDGLPTIAGLVPSLSGSRFLIVPSLKELDEASLTYKRGELSSEPPMEVHLPSVNDVSLAPEGHHVISILVQYVPHAVTGGWNVAHEKLVQTVVQTLALYMPDIASRIVAGEVLTPPDIEMKYSLKEGDWHHGVLDMARLLTLKPAALMEGYGSTIPGLYLGGAAAMAGGISGSAGEAAARAMLKARA